MCIYLLLLRYVALEARCVVLLSGSLTQGESDTFNSNFICMLRKPKARANSCDMSAFVQR